MSAVAKVSAIRHFLGYNSADNDTVGLRAAVKIVGQSDAPRKRKNADEKRTNYEYCSILQQNHCCAGILPLDSEHFSGTFLTKGFTPNVGHDR